MSLNRVVRPPGESIYQDAKGQLMPPQRWPMDLHYLSPRKLHPLFLTQHQSSVIQKKKFLAFLKVLYYKASQKLHFMFSLPIFWLFSGG